MDDAFYSRIIKGYYENKKFVKILADLEELATEDGGILSYLGYPFIINKEIQLIYYKRLNSFKVFYIPFDCVKEIL